MKYMHNIPPGSLSRNFMCPPPHFFGTHSCCLSHFYRYEGLRLEHIKEILRSLKANITREIGPPETRPSAVMFASWISQAGGVVVQCLGAGTAQRAGTHSEM